MKWIHWLKIAIMLMKLFQDKPAGEKASVDEVVNVLEKTEIIKKDQAEEVKEAIPLIGELIDGVSELFETKKITRS